jgi:AraC family transcriptional regulator, regulatory protein of adaptative response / methylated-DNA-[protein]-cysteine methyltransferase
MPASMTRTKHSIEVEQDARWAQVVARDPGADGLFFFSVRTTGVYCRPSCASRRANPCNVSFHATAVAAEAAGFRPCKRCRPDQLDARRAAAERIARACRLIESADEVPTLEQLARSVNLSPFHFHRLFKSATGVTPKQYAVAHRTRKLKAALHSGKSVTAAIFDAGFNSNSRFYENSAALLGMTPTDYRRGGGSAEIRFAVGQCSLGAVLVASSRRGVCAILLGDDPATLLRDLQDRFANATLIGGDRNFEALVARVVGLVEAPQRALDLPLDVQGTAFQQRVWEALRQIEPGSTATYADIACKIGQPAAARAVALACRDNPLAVAIPCHRVVRKDGGLSGYRWGIERKRSLLAREGVNLD